MERFFISGLRVLLVILFVISLALPLAFPIFKFPKPAGPYSIGTISYHWIDSTRRELFSEDTSQFREMMAQVWYPAENGMGTVSPYVDHANAFSRSLTQSLSSNGLISLPSFFFSHFGLVKSNSRTGALPVSNKTFPVLIYLTGLDGFRQANLVQIENFVSHGYIVVGLDQPYTSAAVTFPDGKTILGFTKTAMQRLIDQSIHPNIEEPVLHNHKLFDGIIPYLAQDVCFAINRLGVLNTQPKSVLRSHLNLDRIGVFGVSLGAMIAGESAYSDSRIKASLMMDAAMPIKVAKYGLSQPAMWMTRPAADMLLERKLSGGWTDKDIQETLSTMKEAYAKTRNGYYVSISGMFHVNFTDAPLWSPVLKKLGLVGPIDRKISFDILNDYSLAFFDGALKSNALKPPVVALHNYPSVRLYTSPMSLE